MARQDANKTYATGRRKSSTARVWIMPGEGKITVNKRDSKEYFKRDVFDNMIRQPLQIANMSDKMDVICTIKGGGMSGQAGALKHGIAKALLVYDSTLRAAIKKAGLITRDSRVKERKKPGQPGARKRFQFSKR